MERMQSARKHYWASCQLLADAKGCTKEAVNESIKKTMKVKSHRELSEDVLRELAAGITAMAMGAE